MVSLKAIGIGQVKKPTLQAIPEGKTKPPSEARMGERQVYRGNNQYEEFNIYRRGKLLARNIIYGPAIIEEATANTVIERGQKCTVDKYGNLIIIRKQEGEK
jgi:N-methylhydantoinase A